MNDFRKIRHLRKQLAAYPPEEFAHLEDEKKKEVIKMKRGERLFTYKYDFLAFCMEVLKAESWGDHPEKWAKVHKELCRFLRTTKNLGKNAFIQLPRGHLKTQIATIFYRIWRSMQNPELCSLIVSGTLELSKGTARTIRGSLQNNTLLRDYYGHVLPEYVFNDRRNKWSETQFNVARATNHPQCSFEAVGVEATVTGRHFEEISLDDLVTPENATTKEQCDKVIQAYKYFLSVLNPKHGRFTVVGTPYTDFDLYSYLKAEDKVKTFRTFFRPVFDESGAPIWPESFTREKLHEIAVHQGTYTFSSQYLLDPIPEEAQEFKRAWFVFYSALPRDINRNEIALRHFIIVDPITHKKLTSTSKDRGVVLCIGVDKMDNWYVRQYQLFQRAKEPEMFEAIYRMCANFNAMDVYWESVAYQSSGKYNLEIEAKKKGKPFRVHDIRPGHNNKQSRIRSLIPYFERGQIKIHPTMHELMYELQRFPYGETIDIADALSYMVQIGKPRKRNPFNVRFQTRTVQKAVYF